MGKTVVITGGTSDIGKAIIEKYANNNYNIVFTYNKSENKAKQIEEYIINKGINIKGYKVDLSNEKEIETFTSKIDDIDILINNAAFTCDSDLFSKSSENFLNTYSVNLIAPFLLIKLFSEKITKNNGSIINISSTNGIDTMYSESIDYDASKAALINLTQNIASNLYPARINTVAPGWVETSSVSDMDPKLKTNEINKIVLKRFAKPSEIANVVYFLSSDDASYINGSIIRVDGGKTYEL